VLLHDRFFRFLEGCAPAQPKNFCGSPEGSPSRLTNFSAHLEVRPQEVCSRATEISAFGELCSRTTEKSAHQKVCPSNRLIRRFALQVFTLDGRAPARPFFRFLEGYAPAQPKNRLTRGSPSRLTNFSAHLEVRPQVFKSNLRFAKVGHGLTPCRPNLCAGKIPVPLGKIGGLKTPALLFTPRI